jgi:hypothetical protein
MKRLFLLFALTVASLHAGDTWRHTRVGNLDYSDGTDGSHYYVYRWGNYYNLSGTDECGR